MEPRQAYEEILQLMHTATDLNAAAALLSWDQETYMPPLAADARAEQIATIASITHSILVGEKAQRLAEYFREHLSSADGELSETEKRIARVFTREVQRATKLPEEFVRRKARITSLAQQAWKDARARSDFALFRDYLAQIVDLMVEEASLRGFSEHPYDALLDVYEPGLTSSVLDPIFEKLERATRSMLDYVRTASTIPEDAFLRGYFPRQAQLDVAYRIVAALGFDFKAGRVDLSAHPFCTSFSIRDVRLTTRIDESDIRPCLFGLIHEAGHGLYEQGIDVALERTFARDGASMGIHESQSLFWENIIARSEEFWHWALPILQEHFPSQFGSISPRQFYAAINRVQPSLIRIEADEVTYNLHIIVRYRIEKALIGGELVVDSVPAVWNAMSTDLLGIEVPDDARGCLQDIHWSFGGFGYFPSYTLGKLYAAMFRTALLNAMPQAPEYVQQGRFAPIREWLQEVIHRWGRTVEPAELVKHVTGRSLSEEDFVEYAWQKIRRVYGDS
ncbi:MAG: carboxypeptidase M32 [Bacteroidota bacterium]|nr:carboxypeptidase M32 [Candidatus Kapabacteria bacterium]MCS7302437.1 carboxypeptidase M32 [Candidatus Kapabacteria bacterium]MCX7936326.1 carboxypeptidase M32 [Chlorobiota bacterium]MDW8074393.1 carboxypeptidase M32 [Bacteroidota bacterium]MDW8271131.1 carboxypeptidase M32 [Bacteroidota bacterium]